MPNLCHDVTINKIQLFGCSAVINIRNQFLWSNVVTTIVRNQIHGAK